MFKSICLKKFILYGIANRSDIVKKDEKAKEHFDST